MSSLSPAPGELPVERVLDDLIHRLQNAENGPEVRAALIEARRLKNVTARWAAIPPPPDARRQMLTRVMELSDGVVTVPAPPRAARQEPVTGPQRPYVPPISSKLPPRPSREAASAETLSPPPVPSRSVPPPLPSRSAPPPPPAAGKPASTSARPPPASAKPAAPASVKPPPKSVAPSRGAREETLDDVRVPKPAALPNVDQKARPLTLRPPGAIQVEEVPIAQPFGPAQSSAPSAGAGVPPIRAVGVRGGALEGLSSTISSSKVKAQPPPRPESASDLPPLPPLPGAARVPSRFPPPALSSKPPAQSKPPVLSATSTPLPPAPGDVSVAVAEGVTLVRPRAAAWQPHPLWAGTSIKLLAHDPDKGEYTALVRLSAGSSLPSRRHASVEEMWMVDGAVLVGEVEMKPGEYSRADAGSVHPEIVSTTGCTFLLRGSENDEVVSGPATTGSQ